MTIYPLYIASLILELVQGKPDYVQFYGQFYDDFNINDGSSSSTYSIWMTCHKSAVSVTYTNNYLEVCVNGTKYTSYNNEGFEFNGIDLVPLDCFLKGSQFTQIL